MKALAFRRGVLIVMTALLVGGCGDDDNGSPTSPSPSPSPSPGTSEATITISSAGVVSPKTLTVAAGTRVTMVNNDTRAHDVASDPHPVHTDCPELNQIGFVQPGQSRQSGALNTRRSCSYHDHNDATNTNLQGTIVIQ